MIEAAPFVSAEVYVLVNADGDYVASDDADTLKERYADQIGELTDADGFRIVKITVKVPLPKIIEVAATVPDDEPPQVTAAEPA